MNLEDLQPNDIVKVERDGRTFCSWVVRGLERTGRTQFIMLAHGALGELRLFDHNTAFLTITFLRRPASAQERDLWMALNPFSS